MPSRSSKTLTDRFEQLELDAGAYRARNEKRIEDLHESLQRGRAELAVAQGALETTRRDYARLQRELLPERTAQESADKPVAVDSPKPKEQPRPKNGKGAGRGLKAVEAKAEVTSASPQPRADAPACDATTADRGPPV